VIADEVIGFAGTEPVTKPRTIGRMVHPAADIAGRVEGLWQNDKLIARDRANLIVQRLIEMGWLAGRMHCDVPLALDEDVLPADRPRACGPHWRKPAPD